MIFFYRNIRFPPHLKKKSKIALNRSAIFVWTRKLANYSFWQIYIFCQNFTTILSIKYTKSYDSFPIIYFLYFLPRYELLVDRLFLQDVRLTAGNHEAYFVFEDLVVQILLCFSRDTNLLEHFKTTSASPPHAFTRSNMGQKTKVLSKSLIISIILCQSILLYRNHCVLLLFIYC